MTDYIVPRHHLSDEIARILREEIVTSKRVAGERLPTEQAMARSYGVSRAVIREAISRLKQDGLVETRQGLGAFVSRTGISSAFRIDADEIDLKELALIFELRSTVEAEAAGLAAVRRTKDQVEAMRRAVEDMAEAVKAKCDGAEADAAFHRVIAEATSNRYMVEFMGYMESRLRQAITTARENSSRHPGWGTRVEQEHRAIFDAVEAGDAERARMAMRAHLLNAARRLNLRVTG